MITPNVFAMVVLLPKVNLLYLICLPESCWKMLAWYKGLT